MVETYWNLWPWINLIFYSFEERLAAQRREREEATTELGFKKPLSKEEKIKKKKQRLAAIGNAPGVTEWIFKFRLYKCVHASIIVDLSAICEDKKCIWEEYIICRLSPTQLQYRKELGDTWHIESSGVILVKFIPSFVSGPVSIRYLAVLL